MKLNVQGIVEIVIADPKGICNPPTPPPPLIRQPAPPPHQPVPTPRNPGDEKLHKWGDIAVPQKPSPYTRNVHDPSDPLLRSKWGVGGPMIQQAGYEQKSQESRKRYIRGVIW